MVLYKKGFSRPFCYIDGDIPREDNVRIDGGQVLFKSVGGEGLVYFHNNIAIKLLKKALSKGERKFSNLEEFTKSKFDKFRKSSNFAWVEDLLVNKNGQICGLTMKKVPGISFATLKSSLEDGRVKYDLSDLKKVAINFLTLLIKLHNQKIFIGDINLTNFFVDLEGKFVYFIDCDSYSYGSYYCWGGTKDFQECGEYKETKDIYTEYTYVAQLLFILFFQALPYSSQGDHASKHSKLIFSFVDDPTEIPPGGKSRGLWESFNHDKIKELFVKALSNKQGGDSNNRHLRPTPQEWLVAFRGRVFSSIKELNSFKRACKEKAISSFFHSYIDAQIISFKKLDEVGELTQENRDILKSDCQKMGRLWKRFTEVEGLRVVNQSISMLQISEISSIKSQLESGSWDMILLKKNFDLLGKFVGFFSFQHAVILACQESGHQESLKPFLDHYTHIIVNTHIKSCANLDRLNLKLEGFEFNKFKNEIEVRNRLLKTISKFQQRYQYGFLEEKLKEQKSKFFKNIEKLESSNKDLQQIHLGLTNIRNNQEYLKVLSGKKLPCFIQNIITSFQNGSTILLRKYSCLEAARSVIDNDDYCNCNFLEKYFVKCRNKKDLEEFSMRIPIALMIINAGLGEKAELLEKILSGRYQPPQNFSTCLAVYKNKNILKKTFYSGLQYGSLASLILSCVAMALVPSVYLERFYYDSISYANLLTGGVLFVSVVKSYSSFLTGLALGFGGSFLICLYLTSYLLYQTDISFFFAGLTAFGGIVFGYLCLYIYSCRVGVRRADIKRAFSLLDWDSLFLDDAFDHFENPAGAFITGIIICSFTVLWFLIVLGVCLIRLLLTCLISVTTGFRQKREQWDAVGALF